MPYSLHPIIELSTLLTRFVLGSTLFSQPDGRSRSTRAKLLMTFTSLLECWYFVKRVWSLRMVWISSRTARFLKNSSLPTSYEIQHACNMYMYMYMHMHIACSPVPRSIPFQCCNAELLEWEWTWDEAT